MRIGLKIMVAALLLGGASSSGIAADPAATQPFKLKIGFDTTRIDGPVLPDGTIDYSAALWEKMAAGVTDENNARPLLEKAAPLWKEYVPGVSASDAKISLPGLPDIDEAEKRPWKPEEFPDVAKWIQENDRAITLAVEASNRPRLGPAEPAKGELPNLRLNELQSVNVRMALVGRALGRVATGDQAGARADIAALHRIALLLSSGLDSIGPLVAQRMEDGTRQAQLAALRGSDKDNAAKWLQQRLEMQPVTMPVSALDVVWRYEALHAVMLAIRGHLQDALEYLTGLNLDPLFTGKPADIAMVPGNLNEVDWNVVLRRINALDDEAVAALNEHNFLKRMAATRRFAQALKNEKVPGNPFGDYVLGRMADPDHESLDQPTTDTREAMIQAIETFVRRGDAETIEAYSQRIAQFLTHDNWTMEDAVVTAAENDAKNQVYTAAMALEVYKIENGRYPDALNALVPGILKQLPPDLFSDAPLIYRREGTGYVVYSVGPNGRDDNGETSAFIYSAKDDIVIRSEQK